LPRLIVCHQNGKREQPSPTNFANRSVLSGAAATFNKKRGKLLASQKLKKAKEDTHFLKVAKQPLCSNL
jgi:hypothetical protein